MGVVAMALGIALVSSLVVRWITGPLRRLASAADRIVVGSGAILGSVGAVIEYVDIEPMFEKMGARIVRIDRDSARRRRRARRTTRFARVVPRWAR